MKTLIRIALLALLPLSATADVIQKIKINGVDEPVEFVNNYNLERCLELDMGKRQVVQLDETTCSGLKSHYAKQAEHEKEAQLRAEENNKIRQESELKRQQELTQKEQERAQRDLAYQKDRERIAQLKECEATDAYRLYDAQEAVIEDIETQQNLKKAVARQKQLVNMSGVRRLDVERQIAEEQLAAKESLKEHWEKYKSAGGKAASPQAVKHKIEDPCDSFRPEES